MKLERYKPLFDEQITWKTVEGKKVASTDKKGHKVVKKNGEWTEEKEESCDKKDKK